MTSHTLMSFQSSMANILHWFSISKYGVSNARISDTVTLGWPADIQGTFMAESINQT